MNKHFDQIEGSDWMTKQDRADFARFCYVYSKYIEPLFGQFDWEDNAFVHFCKANNIQPKGNKKGGKRENHFWFNASKPEGLEKARVFDPFGHAGLTPLGEIRMTLADEIKMTPVEASAGEFFCSFETPCPGTAGINLKNYRI